MAVALERNSEPARRHDGLHKAVHRYRAASSDGMLERLFTFAFRGLVYPQIWEDPEIDLEALAITPECKIVTIASGGCNVLNYLTANPKAVTAVDLNQSHVALTELKLCAAANLPDYNDFYEFFGRADVHANIELYDRFLRRRLRPVSRAYWDARGMNGRRRIVAFARNFYRHGLLGRFIGAGHLLSRFYGVNPRELLAAETVDAQRAFFRTRLEPIFDKRFVRWLTSKPVSLYGLGIPPAQFEALALSGDGDMAKVLCARLERLACGFPLSQNYFAWQAFGRCYPDQGQGAVPRYLNPEHYDDIRARADRVSVRNISFTDYLVSQASASLDRYVLLDAQDWMSDEQLTSLWSEITRTARSGARVIFRTAPEPSLLPGRIPEEILSQWDYAEDLSKELGQRDRSSIYGGFHIYVLGDRT